MNIIKISIITFRYYTLITTRMRYVQAMPGMYYTSVCTQYIEQAGLAVRLHTCVRFESRPGLRLSWLFCGFPLSLRENATTVPQLGQTASFQIPSN
jgi:hypothetical protein